MKVGEITRMEVQEEEEEEEQEEEEEEEEEGMVEGVSKGYWGTNLI